jgi:S-adenosylmethionine decarboxylase
MICLEPALYLQVEALVNGPRPFPLQSDFSNGRAHSSLGLSNDRDETLFVCNRDLHVGSSFARKNYVRINPPEVYSNTFIATHMMNGTHLFAEWYQCDPTLTALQSVRGLREACLAATRESGLVCVGHVFQQLQPQGLTSAVRLSESHLAIHSWPQFGFVTLKVYVCNYLTDNTQKALTLYKLLKDYFNPAREKLCESPVCRQR